MSSVAFLATVPEVFLQERFATAEAFGFEAPNRYAIALPNGQRLEAAERSSGGFWESFNRQMGGHTANAFVLDVVDAAGRIVLTLTHPARFFQQEITVQTGSGRVLGTIKRRAPCTRSTWGPSPGTCRSPPRGRRIPSTSLRSPRCGTARGAFSSRTPTRTASPSRRGSTPMRAGWCWRARYSSISSTTRGEPVDEVKAPPRARTKCPTTIVSRNPSRASRIAWRLRRRSKASR